jgi:septal ring factor EnvC (AmiA/AmiB activator)
MITPTRITVDEATREVLDQLSSQLSEAPGWAAQLGVDIQHSVTDATRTALAAPSKTLAQLAATATAMQTQVAAHGETLNGISNTVQLLDERAGQYEASIDKLGGSAVAQQHLLAELQLGHKQLLASGEQAVAVAQRQDEAFVELRATLRATAQQQQENIEKLVAMLQDTKTSLSAVQAAQFSQQQLLQDLMQRIDHLSQPWWKRGSKPSRSQS